MEVQRFDELARLMRIEELKRSYRFGERSVVISKAQSGEVDKVEAVEAWNEFKRDEWWDSFCAPLIAVSVVFIMGIAVALMYAGMCLFDR